jgi:hypothetical protein
VSKIAIIPLQAFLDAKGDSELVADLAKSVERVAVLKFLRMHSENAALPDGGKAIRLLAQWIEEGRHA